jgi:serine/threonine protein kinase
MLTTKVLDFGISVVMRRIGETAPVTKLLAMFGTPAYMAPEAIQFSPAIDGRADVYGFGVLFFEALTGALPFSGPPDLELMARILTEPSPSVTLYRPDLEPQVVRFIARALEKDPKNRFADMAHLIRATEEELLPLLPTPHSLTPISGIVSLPPAEPNLIASTPVARRVLDKASLERGKHRETRVLHSPTGAPWGVAKHTAVAQRRKPRFAHAAVGATIVVFVIGMAWVVLPSASSDQDVEAGQSSDRHAMVATARRPTVTQLPDNYSTRSTFRLAANTKVTPSVLRVAAPHSSRHLLRGRALVRGPRRAALPRRSSAPTAGRMTLLDFLISRTPPNARLHRNE